MSTSNIKRLGDPHLGKSFKNGVPLHRRGEREQSQWHQFHQDLNSGAALHVNMGDLFDTDEVAYYVVLGAARIYKDAARSHPDTLFVVIRGNHDGSRDGDKISAYEVFAELMRGVPNVVVTEDETIILGKRLFVPWTPFKTAAEMIPTKGHFEEVYGHWDVRNFGEVNPNMIPVKELMSITSTVYTGHEHKPAVIRNDTERFDIYLTGSMQPYAHGEEVTPTKYQTLTLEELNKFDQPLHDVCLRLRLRPGESPPDDLDVAQLSIQRISSSAPDGGDTPQVVVEDFNLKDLYEESCVEADVGDTMKTKVWTYFEGEKT